MTPLFSNKILQLQVVATLLTLVWCWSCSSDDANSPTDVLGAFNSKTLQHEGIERTYHVYLPTAFDKSKAGPMVLALHGGGGTGMNFPEDVSAGTMITEAESRGVVLVMPDGLDKRWNDGRTEHFGGDRMYDDVGFISTLIDTMIQDYGVDSDRIYATGISNGGLMSVRLALDLSNKIAAIAPVTAQLSKAVEAIVPDLPVSVMIVNGDEDPLVPYDGGCIDIVLLPGCRGEVLSTQESIAKFSAYNQCTSPAEIEPIIDEVPNDGTSIEVTRHTACADGAEVVLVKVIGGGHTWPMGAQYLPVNLVGRVSKEINASSMIFDFFLSHSRN